MSCEKIQHWVSKGPVSPAVPIGFDFAPAGLLFPYYLGPIYELRRLGFIQGTTPLGGGSAGAVAAALMACEIRRSAARRATLALLRVAQTI
jgi:hypothetical protein